MEFYLRQLVNHYDLLTLTSTLNSNAIVNNTAAPIDILKLELRHLEKSSPGLPLALTRVETRRWWYVNPHDSDWEPSPSILSRDSALSRIRVARLGSPADDLWIFTDGSVEGCQCGASAVLYVGGATSGSSTSFRFIGHHSSTQAELVAIKLGCDIANDLSDFKRITFVSDSQSALQAICVRQGGSDLAVAAREALTRLRSLVKEVRIWWTPSHAGLAENDQADHAAKQAAKGLEQALFVDTVPECQISLKRIVRQHYVK